MFGIGGHIAINVSRIEGTYCLDLGRADDLLVSGVRIESFSLAPEYAS
jgi:hypothetical protein